MPDFREFQRILDGEHVIAEANGTMSREQVMLLRGGFIESGTVMGRILRGGVSVVAAAHAGNVGNGTFAAAPTADAGAPAGRYQLRIEAAAANGGLIGVYDPDGVRLGDVGVGVAYDGPINFTLNDGAVDFVVGDGFDVTVGYAAANLWTPLDPAGVDGRERAAGIMFHKRRELLGADTRRGVVHLRDCDVNGKKIIWPAGMTEAARKTQEGYLAEAGVLVRY